MGCHRLLHILAAATVKSLQLCLTLCDPIDGSPPGSAVPEILQARTLEWVAISFSNEIFLHLIISYESLLFLTLLLLLLLSRFSRVRLCATP